MNVNKYTVPLILILCIFGSVATGIATGTWKTSGRIVVSSRGRPLSPDDLKGWMTLSEVSTGARVPLDWLYSELGLELSFPPSTQLREMENISPKFETSSVRAAVRLYQSEAAFAQATGGQEAITDQSSSITPETGTLPIETVAAPKPSIEQVQVQAQKQTQPQSSPTPKPESQHVEKEAQEQSPEPPVQSIDLPSQPSPKGSGTGTGSGELPKTADDIRGRTRLPDVSRGLGIPLSKLIEGLGLPEDLNPALTLKQINDTYGVEVEAVKELARQIMESR